MLQVWDLRVVIYSELVCWNAFEGSSKSFCGVIGTIYGSDPRAGNKITILSVADKGLVEEKTTFYDVRLAICPKIEIDQ